MNGIRKVLSILLLCFANVLGNDDLKIREPVFTREPDGFRIVISDPNKSYDNVHLEYDIQCNSHKIEVPKKILIYDNSRKEWFDEVSGFNSSLCEKDNKFFYQSFIAGGYKYGNSIGDIKQHITTETTAILTTKTTQTQRLTKTTTIKPTTEPITTTTTKIPCSYSKTTINNNAEICKGELIFEDNFEVMNWTTWNREVRIPLSSSDADFVSFQDSERNLYIKDGILYIVPTLLEEMAGYNDETISHGNLDLGLKCTGKINRDSECKRQAKGWQILPPIVSGRIRTKFSFKYGKVEIKAKMPKGDWIFPQIFLEPQNYDYGAVGYSSGQIRLAFIRGNDFLESKEGSQIDGYRLYGGVVLTTGEQLREHWMKYTLTRYHFGNDFHVYTMIWTDESITFEIDGMLFAQLNGDFAREAFNDKGIAHAENWLSGGKMAPFDKECYLTLGVSAGGRSDFPEGSKDRGGHVKPWKNRDPKNELNFWNSREKWHGSWMGENVGLKIDYVRVWAL